MKLCPHCEFIYEDDQTVCDMDGKALIFEPTLNAFPGNPPLQQGGPLSRARAPQSPHYPRYRRLAVSAMTGLVLGVTLVLFYYVFTQPVSSAEPAAAPTSTSNPVLPVPKKSASPSALGTPVASGSVPGAGEAGSAESNSAKADSTANAQPQPYQHAVPGISPGDLSATKRTYPEATVAPAAAAKTASALSISSLPKVEALPRLKPLPKLGAPKTAKRTETATASQRHVSVKEKKESRFGSFLKKTARVLKKPFKS